MKPNLLAFCGPAGVGKTTAGAHLVKAHGFVRMSFADPLRDMLRALGLRDEHFGPLKETPCDLLLGKTPRYALQTLGTEWGRDKIGAELWCASTSARVRRALEGGTRVVIDDCRFDNEARAIAALGGLVVQLHRPGVERRMGHVSEAGISPDLVNFYLDALSIDDLHRRLDELAGVEVILA